MINNGWVVQTMKSAAKQRFPTWGLEIIAKIFFSSDIFYLCRGGGIILFCVAIFERESAKPCAIKVAQILPTPGCQASPLFLYCSNLQCKPTVKGSMQAEFLPSSLYSGSFCEPLRASRTELDSIESSIYIASISLPLES